MPAAMGFVVFQGEMGFSGRLWAGDDGAEKGLEKLQTHASSTACLTEAQKTCAEEIIREAGDGLETIALVSVSHRPLSTTQDAVDDNHDRTRAQNSARDFVLKHRFALHLCGHEHGGGTMREPVPQLIGLLADDGFNVAEFSNPYPAMPILSEYKRLRFSGEENELGIPTAASMGRSRYYGTVHTQRRQQEEDLTSYIALFGGDRNGVHRCLYSDVYTRYLPWIFDTADASSPDLLWVPHVGPILDWLDEPMNLSYFTQQWLACREGKLHVLRFWLVLNQARSLARQAA